MQTRPHILTLTLAIIFSVASTAAVPGAEKDQKAKASPKGGRLLEKTQPAAEVVVEEDRTVTINFYDANFKPVAASTQAVTVLAEAKEGRTKLDFEKKGDVLVSKSKLPAGEGYVVVVQFKQTPETRPQNFRFKLDMHKCHECHRAEYACICDH